VTAGEGAAFRLQDRKLGDWWRDRATSDSLEMLKADMRAIDSYRGPAWPQRILDDAGAVVAENAAAQATHAPT
jgi:hypothetical protein